MFKQLPSRNHRSKGLKVKHVLQICVLLAICIWLIYQVKHSHEKRGVFVTKDGKVMKVQSNDEIERIGRKDIPRVTEISTEGEKNDEEDEDKEGEDEENKHEDDESEREDVRLVEPEDERGVGDDEIDEHETEKVEAESEHEEDAVDEDKEKEEKEDKEDKEEKEEKEDMEEKEEKEEEVSTEKNHTESEENEDNHEKVNPEEEENEDAGKEGHTDFEENDDIDKDGHNKRNVKSEEEDHVVERTNTREAQEELYRADDASSEVTQNVQSVIPKTENSTVNHSNQIWRKVHFGQKEETNTSDIVDGSIKPEVRQRDDVDSGISNATNSDQKKNEVNLTNPDDIEMTSNSTAVGGDISATLLHNGTETSLDSNLSRNGTVKLPDHEELNLPGNSIVRLERATDEKYLQEAAVDANKVENVNTGVSQSSYNTTLASSLATNDTDVIEATKDESQGVKAENSEKGGSDDPIDASDVTNLAQEEKESRTDLDTLPEIRTEVQNTEDTVAE